MEKSSIIALGFLIIGGAFVYTLLKALWDLISTDVKGKTDAKSMLKHFKRPLISFLILILFIAFIVPALSN